MGKRERRGGGREGKGREIREGKEGWREERAREGGMEGRRSEERGRDEYILHTAIDWRCRRSGNKASKYVWCILDVAPPWLLFTHTNICSPAHTTTSISSWYVAHTACSGTDEAGPASPTLSSAHHPRLGDGHCADQEGVCAVLHWEGHSQGQCETLVWMSV